MSEEDAQTYQASNYDSAVKYYYTNVSHSDYEADQNYPDNEVSSDVDTFDFTGVDGNSADFANSSINLSDVWQGDDFDFGSMFALEDEVNQANIGDGDNFFSGDTRINFQTTDKLGAPIDQGYAFLDTSDDGSADMAIQLQGLQDLDQGQFIDSLIVT